MTAMDRLMKSLEALKISLPLTSEDISSKKKENSVTSKEKIVHCSNIADAICSPSLRSMVDFPKVLGLAMETFLWCCDDENSDVRLMANECLNRTIKTLLDSHLGRLLVELFKEIKKDGPARSLRAALTRFGEICHLMRPQKCRPYTVNLVPTLAKISQRNGEESVQETLANVVAKVMPVLGQFTNGKDIKMLLKAFLPNLIVKSAIVRRSASTSLICICQHSRRPSSFYSWLLLALFEMILPVQEEHPVFKILGVMSCLRYLVPKVCCDESSFQNPKGNISLMQNEEEMCITQEQILKVYELTLYFVNHSDHNVVTATLETLYQLLKHAPKVLQLTLLSRKGITKSLIYESEMPKLSHLLSESQNSITQSGSIDESCLEDEHDIYIAKKRAEDLSFPDYTETDRSITGISMNNTNSIEKDSEEDSIPAHIKTYQKDSLSKDWDEELWDQKSVASSSCAFTSFEFKAGNIGSFTDPDIPLKYCIRLLSSSFLLSGSSGVCLSDKTVRISVKSLALGCLSNIFSLYPCGFFLPLHINGNKNETEQQVSEVILYATHGDPHIRGQIAHLIGCFLSSSFREAGGCYNDWLSLNRIICAPSVERLIVILISIVQDSSSVASKLGLVGVKQCLNNLLNSYDALEILPLLETLLEIKDNSYWLSKVEFTEVMSSLSFRVIHYLESKQTVNYSLSRTICFQEKMLNSVLFPLLGDEDFRVRQASAVSLVKLVPNFYFSMDHVNEDAIISVAKENIDMYLNVAPKASLQSFLPLVHGLVKPFLTLNSFPYNPSIEVALSRVINLLVTKLRMCSSKHLIYGCCHALCLLSEEFLVTNYCNAWNAVLSDNILNAEFEDSVLFLNLSAGFNTNKVPSLMSDLLSNLLCLIDTTPLCLDLVAHQHVLQLSGNLLSGVWYKLFENQKNNASNLHFKLKSYFLNLVETLFHHVMRLLNIFAHVLEEQCPFPLNVRTALPSLPNAISLSPIKRKNKSKEEASSTTASVKDSPSRSIDKNDAEKEKGSYKIGGGVGQFHTFSLYMKLFDILKGAHQSYKISTEFYSNEKFLLLLKCTLNVLSQILELSETQTMSKNAEEILCYLKSVMVMEPCSSVQCVRQLLKCLFGTNLMSVSQEAQLTSKVIPKTPPMPGLYHTIISYPFAEFSHSLSDRALKNMPVDENLVSFKCMNWMKHGIEKFGSLMKSGSKGGKANLAAHIRLFEGVVIRALQQYTISSDIYLQCQVLDLLAQLIQLRVNYCLLDADQIFIGYVIKQFDFIEEGQIQNANILVPKIFYFLILLSYERYHSKPIISVSKIFQLCDGLIASGQAPDKYVVPALQPVIEDLFIVRNMEKMDFGKELDVQKEVIVATLFKLACYPQVLDLFFLILVHSRQEGEDKWRKTSRQIVDVILPLLARQQIKFETELQLNNLHKLLENMAPNVFRPVDILLKALFSQPKDINDPSNIHRWMCMVLAILKVIISQANEEAIFSRLSDMEMSIKVFKLGVSNLVHEKEQYEVYIGRSNSSPSYIFSRFLFQITGVVVESMCNHVYSPTLKFSEDIFLTQLTSHLLLYLTYMFQSGTFRRLASSAKAIIKEDIDAEHLTKVHIYYLLLDINDFFFKLVPFYPTIVIQWCNLMNILNCGYQSFWSKILSNRKENVDIQHHSVSLPGYLNKQKFLPCNLEMVHRGGVILLCDYVCINSFDVIQMTWLIVNHVKDITDLSLETTVQEFIRMIHQNQASSGLWLQATINIYQEIFHKPFFWKKALHCLANIHFTHLGKLLNWLVYNLFSTHHLLISSISSQLACKIMENFLTEPASNQLCLEDVTSLIDYLQSHGFTKRFKTFMSLCEKQKYNLSKEIAVEPTPSALLNLGEIETIKLNKESYHKSVKEKCLTSHSVEECAHLLAQLKYEDIILIMSSEEFHPSIFDMCLRLGSHLISSVEKYSTIRSDDPFIGVTESPGNILYRASKNSFLQHLKRFLSLPRTFKNLNDMQKMYSEDSFTELLYFIASTSCCYLKTLETLPCKTIPCESLEDIALLSIVSCETLFWIFQSGKRVSLDFLKSGLLLLENTLKNSEIAALIDTEYHISWICSTISTVFALINLLEHRKKNPNVVNPHFLQNSDLLNDEQKMALNACVKIVELIAWLENSKSFQAEIGEQLFQPIKGIITGLARLKIVNSFARIPPVLWQLGWSPELSDNFTTTVPPPPGEFLQDRDVLKQYIYRINLLGWISRQQFEETWMALLGVLSATPINDIYSTSKMEDQERIRASCLAVKSITSLLLQTLLPHPGNPQNGSFLLRPIDKPLDFHHTKCGKKLMSVRSEVYTALQNIFQFKSKTEDCTLNINAENVASLYTYSLSQVSLEYLSAAAKLLEEYEDQKDLEGSVSSNSSPISSTVEGSVSSNSSPISSTVEGIASFQLRDQCLTSVGLDIHSCLHFLLDLYSQWLSPQSCIFTPLTLLTEVIKSIVALSDIFMEKAQYEWMLDTFLEVQKIHPAEDEIIAQYLMFGICKTVAVLGTEQDFFEKLKKMLDLSLKSPYIPTRISTLQGLLYLLQHGSKDETFSILSIATNYMVTNMDTSYWENFNAQVHDHILIMWAVTFYVLENHQDDIPDEEFCQKLHQLLSTFTK